MGALVDSAERPTRNRQVQRSALYAGRHPGTLNLDIDELHRFVGGWQDPNNHAHALLGPVALAMASTHLAGGRDVVLPQYLEFLAAMYDRLLEVLRLRPESVVLHSRPGAVEGTYALVTALSGRG